MTSWELYHNITFYTNHPIISKVFEENPNQFRCEGEIFSYFLTDYTFKTFNNENLKKSVTSEALNSSRNCTWSPFLCVLALASVTRVNINSVYPFTKHAGIFNRLIEPRECQSDETLDILWCSKNVESEPVGNVIPNHIVPIVKRTEIYNSRIEVKQETSPPPPTTQQNVSPKLLSVTSVNDSQNSLKDITYQTVIPRHPSPETASNVSNINLTLHVQPVSEEQPLCKVAKIDNIHKYDIGLYIDRIEGLSDNEKYDLVQNVWVPSANFEYPFTNGRRFNSEWLTLFNGLCYSKYSNGALCLPCVLFGKFSNHKSKLQQLFTKPLNIWGSARGKLNSHFGYPGEESKCHIHKDSVCMFVHFMHTRKIINLQLDKERVASIRRNREVLQPIIETIVFLGRQNLPFRGNGDDSTKYYEEEGNQSTGSVDLFQNLLNFRVSCGDKVLEEHLNTVSKNAKYASSPIQNEIIEACGRVVIKKLVEEIRNSVFFTVIAEEAEDFSNKELKLALVVRYLDSNSEICEHFLSYIDCNEGVTAEAIKEKILAAFAEIGLDFSLCRGQGYDGGGNMAGKYRDVAALITSIYPFAIYFHCANHKLNMCVQKTCSVQLVRNIMNNIKKIFDFFSLSSKRQQCLEKHINIKAKTPESRTKLVNVCRTQWVAHIDVMVIFENLLPFIVSCLDEMFLNEKNTYHRETSATAANHLHLLLNFEFLTALGIGRRVLDYVRPATVKLRSRENDILTGYDIINVLKDTIKDLLNNINAKHDEWYGEVLKVAESLRVDEKMPRNPRHTIDNDNPPTDTATVYYKRTISIPLINHLLVQLDERFTDNNARCAKSFSIIPGIMLSFHGNNWKANFLNFLIFFLNDMPSPESIASELDIWFTYWSKYFKGDVPTSILPTLKCIDKTSFPNVYTCLKILAVMPLTSCECESCISTFRRFKTYTRSTMVQERMNGLALLYIHKNISVSAEEVLNIFS